MVKPIAKIEKKRKNKIVVQTRIPIATCNTIDLFAKDKGMTRSECLKHVIEKAAEFIRMGHIQ